MPRRARIEAPGAIHHVIARGNAGCAIFVDDEDRRWFVGQLAGVSEREGWRVHAYCLMDTHIHAVVETPKPTLGAGMQRLLGGHAFDFNQRHGRFGHLFAGPYWASAIETDAYAIEVCAYVVLNPVRAGLVASPAEWTWSSYRATAGISPTPRFLDTRLVPSMLNPERKRAQELYRQLVRETAQRPRPGSG